MLQRGEGITHMMKGAEEPKQNNVFSEKKKKYEKMKIFPAETLIIWYT